MTLFKKPRLKKLRSRFYKLSMPKRLALVFIPIFALVGVTLLVYSLAYSATLSQSAEIADGKHVNDYRAANGKAAYRYSGCLWNLARIHSAWMAQNANLTHTTDLFNKVQSACGGKLHSIGENIAYSPNEATNWNMWLNSPPHRNNILGGGVDQNGNPLNFRYVGIGAYRSGNGALYMTQIFADCYDCGGNWPKPDPITCAASKNTLASGATLYVGKSRTSCDERFKFNLYNNGTVILFQSWVGPIWAKSGGGSRLVMKTNGNLVLYNSSGKSLWSSGTYNHPGAKLIMQNDGNAVIYHNGKPIWNTNTGNR